MIKWYVLKKVGDGQDFLFKWDNEAQNYWDTAYTNTSVGPETHISRHEYQITRDPEKVLDGTPITNWLITPFQSYLNKFYGHYEWKEIHRKVSFRNIDAMVFDLSAEELKDVASYCFMRIDYNETTKQMVGLPNYYGMIDINCITDTNEPNTSYRIKCGLDHWTTDWSIYHHFMKECLEKFDAADKECDRVRFCKYSLTPPDWDEEEQTGNKEWTLQIDEDSTMELNDDGSPVEGEGNWTWTINYLKDIYLNRVPGLSNGTPLLCYDTNDGLNIDEWINLNGVSISDRYLEGKVGKVSCIIPSQETTDTPDGEKPDPELFDSDLSYYSKGIDATPILDLLDDKYYNSQGKYQYICLKLGAEDYWDGIDVGEGDDKHREMITKTCMKAKNFKAYSKDGSDKTFRFNSEALCLFPVPSGERHDDFIESMGRNKSDLVIGDGVLLGSVVNDIPFQVMAAALKHFNKENPDKQTIGDKLSNPSFTNSFAYTTMKVVNDGVDKKWNKINVNLINDIPDLNGTSDDQRFYYEWYSCKRYRLVTKKRHIRQNEKIDAGYYWVFSTENSSEISEEHQIYWEQVTDPTTGFKWKLSDLIKEYFTPWIKTEWGPPHAVLLYGLYEYKPTFSPDKNPAYVKRNWRLIGVCAKDCTKSSGVIHAYDDHYWRLNSKFKLVPEYNSEFNSVFEPNSDEYKSYTISELEDGTTIPSYRKAVFKYDEDNLNIYTNIDFNNEEGYLPCIFHDFSSIPIVIAKKDIDCGSDYFDSIQAILENRLIEYTDEEGHVYTKGLLETNTFESHPIKYSQQIYRWTYLINAQDQCSLTSDMIDWTSYMLNDWEITLDMNITNKTNYRLNISELRNKIYPMSKSGMELIFSDRSEFPFCCSQFNNWLLENANTIQSSLESKNMANRYNLIAAQMRYWSDPIGSMLSSAGSGLGVGAGIGATTGNPYAAAVGAGVGAVVGLVGGALTGGAYGIGTKWSNEQADAQWELRWNTHVANYIARPEVIKSAGFDTGSLLFNPHDKAWNDKYELFRRYSIPKLEEEKIWHDVSMNGEQFLSQCKYKDYDNRIYYNYVNFNLDDKQYIALNYLKKKMIELDPIFAQNSMIQEFFKKCKMGFRVFKDNLFVESSSDETTMDNVVKSNVEWKLQWAKSLYNTVTNINSLLKLDVLREHKYYPYNKEGIIEELKTFINISDEDFWKSLFIEINNETTFTITASTRHTDATHIYRGSIKVTDVYLYNGWIEDDDAKHYFYDTKFLENSSITSQKKSIICPDGTSYLTNEFDLPIKFIDDGSLTKIGDGFLRFFPLISGSDTRRTAFNQPLKLPNTLTSVGKGFMNNQYAYDNVVDVGELPASIFKTDTGIIHSFSSRDGTSPCYTNGIKLKGVMIDGVSSIDAYKARFQDSGSGPLPLFYRKLIDVTE